MINNNNKKQIHHTGDSPRMTSSQNHLSKPSLPTRLHCPKHSVDELKKQSENEMSKCLTWVDLVWLGFGSVVGSDIFTITGLEARDDAGPAIVLSYAVSGLSALFSVFCYTEFAVEIPVAGGSFSYLRVELGDFVAFIAAGNHYISFFVFPPSYCHFVFAT